MKYTFEMYHEPCLEGMKKVPDKSVDLIICDLPYGTTNNHWDIVIPFAPLWEQYNRIAKENAAVILFGQGLFSVDTINSNRENFRYNLIWNKILSTGFLNANKMPLRVHEDINVFYRKMPTYNPQRVKGSPCHSAKVKGYDVEKNTYGKYTKVVNLNDMKYPTSILTYQKPHSSVQKHPSEKPLALIENLVLTYSNEGDTVMDNCTGSGTTGVASLNCHRNFIGFEKEQSYYELSCERIENAYEKANMLLKLPRI